MMLVLTLFTCLLLWRWLQTRSEDNPRKLMGSICVALMLGLGLVKLFVDDGLRPQFIKYCLDGSCRCVFEILQPLEYLGCGLVESSRKSCTGESCSNFFHLSCKSPGFGGIASDPLMGSLGEFLPPLIFQV